MTTKAKAKNKVNVSINSIEKTAVVILDKAREEKRKHMLNKDIVKELKDYIFGSEDSTENPFGDITAAYHERLQELREKMKDVAKKEKTAYMGKSKKGVKGIAKVIDEELKEVQTVQEI
jgi:hypothetical protein